GPARIRVLLPKRRRTIASAGRTPSTRRRAAKAGNRAPGSEGRLAPGSEGTRAPAGRPPAVSARPWAAAAALARAPLPPRRRRAYGWWLHGPRNPPLGRQAWSVGGVPARCRRGAAAAGRERAATGGCGGRTARRRGPRPPLPR